MGTGGDTDSERVTVVEGVAASVARDVSASHTIASGAAECLEAARWNSEQSDNGAEDDVDGDTHLSIGLVDVGGVDS